MALPSSTRPRGDITTVLDLASRDSQDGYLFPLDTQNSWFHRDPSTFHPATPCIQEFTHKGTAEWGGLLTFDLGSLTSGDILQTLVLQFRLGHWYPFNTIANLQKGTWTVDPTYQSWTYANNLGLSVIEYAEFVAGDQTLERITGEFIQTFLSTYSDVNMLYGYAIDGAGRGTIADLATNSHAFNKNRPWPTENGTYFTVLPFFFFRNRLKEVFPLLSCTEGTVRVNVKLRSFTDMVRSTRGFRESCDETPLNQTATFIDNNQDLHRVQTASQPPQFADFRIVTYTALVSGTIRSSYLRKPFELFTQFVQTFHFDEPLKYLASKRNANTDTVDISLPLELNHPTKELFWVFRRKGIQINNEWYNFSPTLETQYTPQRLEIPWLSYASLRVNGMIIEQADGDWWRWRFASRHRGGITTYSNNIYGYSFARKPDDHQPSGHANMSRANTVRLNLTVNVPRAVVPPPGFDVSVAQGWEVYVFVIHYNWIRFENGLCQKLYNS
jgi:hypothetical protein